MHRIAVLDDYQGVALASADWSVLDGRAEVVVFRDHLSDEDALVERLAPFDVVCVMRERTPLGRSLIDRLPNLRMIASTAPRNASIDMDAARERGIEVRHTGYSSNGAIELTWALILGAARHLPIEAGSVRAGGWMQTVGTDLAGSTLGIVGLGRIGVAVACIAQAFGMTTLAWSQNLTTERAEAAGVRFVDKATLFRESDIVTIHLVLSDRTRAVVGAAELALMKPAALLVNSSRGPLVDEPALIDALQRGTIGGAALDTYDVEPLPANHPYRTLPNVLATPHIGFVTKNTYAVFYRDTVANIVDYLAGSGQAQGAEAE
jgi:phosphoglycerate dehydrogenase-like enzyme